MTGMCYCFFDDIEVRSWQRRQAIEWVEAYKSYQSWISHGTITIYPETPALFTRSLDYNVTWHVRELGNRKQMTRVLHKTYAQIEINEEGIAQDAVHQL